MQPLKDLNSRVKVEFYGEDADTLDKSILVDHDVVLDFDSTPSQQVFLDLIVAKIKLYMPRIQSTFLVLPFPWNLLAHL